MNNNNNFDSDSCKMEREPLTNDFDFLETATQYLHSTDGFFRHTPTSVQSDDQEQSSSTSTLTSSFPPASAFNSPAHSYTRSQKRNDESSASGVSWNSANANSQMSTWSPSFISHYMIPWQQEEKPSSWDQESDEGDAEDRFRDEPQARKMAPRSIASVVSKASTKNSYAKSTIWGFCCMEIEIPIRVAYSIVVLVIGLSILCFVIGLQAEHQWKKISSMQQEGSITSTVLTPIDPIAPPTPTLAPTVMTEIPSPAPSIHVTPQPTQCNESKLTVDKLCYVSSDDGILIEFDVCNSRESDWIGIYPISTDILLDDYVEWSWSCGTKLCREHPRSNDFVISTERIAADGLYRAYYMKYNNDGTPFASVAMSEIFQISSRCM